MSALPLRVMTVADIDTAGFRHWYDSGRRTGREISPPQVIRDVFDLCDEIDRLRREWDTLVNERADLRARLAEVEAERDQALNDCHHVPALVEVEAERDAAIAGSREIRGTLLAAEARLAAVEAMCNTAASWQEPALDDLIQMVRAAARGEGDR